MKIWEPKAPGTLWATPGLLGTPLLFFEKWCSALWWLCTDFSDEHDFPSSPTLVEAEGFSETSVHIYENLQIKSQLSDPLSWYWVFRCFPNYLQANTVILLQITTLSRPPVFFSVRHRISYHSTLLLWYVLLTVWPGICIGQTPLSYSEVQEIIQIYLYSPSGPLWFILGW